MNFNSPDHLYELNRQKINRDRAFILKEEMLKPKPAFGSVIERLGGWMIAKGEQLRRRTVRPILLQDQARLFKA